MDGGARRCAAPPSSEPEQAWDNILLPRSLPTRDATEPILQRPQSRLEMRRTSGALEGLIHPLKHFAIAQPMGRHLGLTQTITNSLAISGGVLDVCC